MTCPFGYGAPAAPAAAGPAATAANGANRDRAESTSKKTFSVLGFETDVVAGDPAFSNEQQELCNYTDYIRTESLLGLQDGESIMKPDKKGMMHHEELLFIITHQSIELWFKVLLKDLVKGRDLIRSACPSNVEDSEVIESWRQLELVGHYLRRATMIFHQAAGSFAVLQTMHPADFLEFRDFLVPASGFQSYQFRQIEILLGLNEAERAMCNGSHVFNALKDHQKLSCEQQIEQAESLKNVVENLLLSVNVPDAFLTEFYRCTEELHVARQKGVAHHVTESAVKMAKEALEGVKKVIEAPNTNLDASAEEQKKASEVIQAALYVNSYRSAHPHFSILSQILDEMVALEEGLLLFRARHSHNVERIIGRRIGTGGSSGVEYLEKTREYRIFTSLWSLRQVLIRSSILPELKTLHGKENINEVALFKPKKAE